MKNKHNNNNSKNQNNDDDLTIRRKMTIQENSGNTGNQKIILIKKMVTYKGIILITKNTKDEV